MNTVWQDIQFAIRSMFQRPGYTVVIALSLGLGIGANTAIFTLINAVFLHPLPVKDIGSLVSIYTSDARNPGFLGLSYPNFRDFRDKNNVLAGVLASAGINVARATDSQPEQIVADLVSGNYFDVLGVKPSLGRTFLPEEDGIPSAHPVVVLSHAFWTREYAANPGVVGTQLNLNGHKFLVIGVAAAGFNGTNALGVPALWAPLAMHAELMPEAALFEWRRFLWLNVVGRLKPGETPQRAQAALQALAKELEREYPDENRGRSVKLYPLAETLIDPNGRDNIVNAGQLLMSVVGLILLIACANVANLLLVRASGRRKEMAIRLSMGASTGRLVRQLLTESLLFGLLGGATGLFLADWGRNALWSFRPPFLKANDLDLGFDTRVLLFTLGVSVLTGLLFGLAPALQAAGANLITDLRERSAHSGRANHFFSLRNLLVVGQVALSLVALVGAGLFLRSMRKAQDTDPGFAARKIATFEMSPGKQGYSEARTQQFYRQAVDRLRNTPGIEAVSLTSWLPLGFDGLLRTVLPEGQETSPGNRLLAIASVVWFHYFETMEIPLLRGRTFDENDRAGSRKVAVINATMALKFWPNQDALGQRFRFFGETEWTQIVGIVKDSKYGTVAEAPRACAYVPALQYHEPIMNVVLRGSGDPSAALATARREVQALDRDLLLTNPFTMTELIDRSLWASRMGAGLLAVFGFLALALSSIGVYGVMAFTVSQRTNELGIRLALGARRGDVFRLVMWQGLLVIGSGVLLGLLGAYALSRYISNLLFGISAHDTAAFALTPLILIAVALLATFLPARRATSIDPALALHIE